MITDASSGLNGVISDALGVDVGRLQQPLMTNASDPAEFSAALREWQAAVGRPHVLSDAASRDVYAETTLPEGTRPACIVRPESVAEVQQVVSIAARHGIRWHAISRGCNWGYGDRCAPTDGQLIIELSRMNRIREVNVELGYAVLEPGVSQQQLYNHLTANDLPLLLDATGAGPDASIVGNILQRGFGHTPYGDRFRHTSGLEVVLPNGELLRTGFGKHDNAQAARVFPWGQGPWVDGLFTQSNYGVVTSACVWLMPRPEVIEGFALKIDDEAKLGGVLTALRRLRMAGTVRSTVHVANDLRVLSARIGYPWERTGGATPLPDDVRAELRREHGLGAWNVLGGLYGTRREVAAARYEVRRAFRGIARPHFFRRSTLNKAARVKSLLKTFPAGRRLAAAIDSAASAFDLLEGVPSAEHLKGAFWRCRDAAAVERGDVRKSGLAWISPVVPLSATAAADLLRQIEPVFRAHGFDLLITMTAVSDRALCCVTSVNFDRDDPADCEAAASCMSQLHECLRASGYYGYRGSSVE